jgi:lipopolysaccharide export LptBFGC system permease protein LptF
MPLGYLLSTVVTYGRLAADNEWTAIRMSGLNPLKMVVPALLLALPLCAFTQWLVGDKLPRIRLDQERYKFVVAREKLRSLSPGQTELHLGEFYLSAGNRDGDDFLDAFIKVPGSHGETDKKLVAQRVHFEFKDDDVYIHLVNARMVNGVFDFSNANPVFRISPNDWKMKDDDTYDSLRYKSSREIEGEIARGDLEPEQADVFRFEIHQRRAFSVTYVMFLLLGIPTGLILRRGTQLGALSIAVGYALLYYVLSMRLSRELGASHVVPPLLAAWTVDIAGCAIGVWLLRRALRQ